MTASAADAQDAPATPEATPELRTTVAGEGVYSEPMWLPLRRDLPGSEVIVGCTLNSHGSENGYSCGGHHGRWAIDFIAETGTPVYAAGAGFATNMTGQPGGSGFGGLVHVDHGFGVVTVYAHLSSVAIGPEGAWVDENTLVGEVGNTGSSSTPHLHYEVYAPGDGTNGKVSVDPGPLHACRGDLLVAFPHVAGYDSWDGLSWGSLTVASDGNGCVSDPDPPLDPTAPWVERVASVLDEL